MTRAAKLHDIADITSIDTLVQKVHTANAKWWHDKDGNRLERNAGELIALMHSELSETLEAVRKSLTSDHIPRFSGEEEEIADTLIRLLDYAGGRGLRLGEAFEAKMKYNATRADHKYEAREAVGGKRF